MCGFTGFTNFIKDDGTVLGRMMDRIVHRGPDASGQFVDTDIALGFRRLSIIDLAEGGQPMFNEDKSLVLVFNGEIYNFKELRAELLEKGHVFANNSDSEVLLHGFEEWGESMVPRLRGMFAFVIFDRRDRSLFAARDMFGIKPFYYSPLPGGKGLLFGVLEYFADLTDKAVRESVAAHKIADVEVGSFLSSGIDSSYIAEAANVDKTFTVGFESPDGDRYNEIHFAKKFADTIGVENISKIITPEEYWGTFPKIQYHMDEPLADPAAIALYFVSQLASKYVKVVMSGEGADELFGGYRIYQEPITLTAYDKLPFGIRRVISKICEHLPQKHGINYLVRRGKTIEERFIGNASIFSTKERNALLKSDTAKKAVSPQVLCSKFYNEVKGKDDITKMQYLDINMWLMGDILLKADKTSMANSLELRVPFLDKKVMELAETIPLNCRVSTKTTKLALRKAAEKTLPKLTAEKDKLGFPVPIRVWLKEDKYYNTVKEEFTGEIADKFFNTEKLIALLDGHRAGKADNSRKIWTVYTFIIWYKQYFAEV